MKGLIRSPVPPVILAAAVLLVSEIRGDGAAQGGLTAAVLARPPVVSPVRGVMTDEVSAPPTGVGGDRTPGVPAAGSAAARARDERTEPAGGIISRPDGRWEIVLDPGVVPRGEAVLGPSQPVVFRESAPEAPRAEETREEERYRIRAGDLLDIFVWGQDALSGPHMVGRDGTISVRLAGTVDVAGLTLDEAASRISSRLREYIVEPAVSISLQETTGRDVLVVGKVANPGNYPLPREMTVLEILLEAETTDEADLSGVTIVRGDTVIRCDMNEVLAGRDVGENRSLLAGDLLIVPGRENVISLLGAVESPGRYNFERDREVTVRDLLIEGSIFTDNASLSEAFVLRDGGGMEPIDLNALWFRGDLSQDLRLHTGDALVIPETEDIGVYVLGKVASPGLYHRGGEMNLLQALTFAEPDPFGARLWDARVVRGWPDSPRVFHVDVQALLEGDLSENIMMEDGDVVYIPETGVSYTLEFWNRVLGPLTGVASTVATLDVINDN